MKLLSRNITTWLIASKTIDPEDRELYEYAVSCLFITLSPLLLILCIGFLLGMVRESIVLIIPFMTIRKFSGGIHAKSPFVCFVSSTGLLFFFLLIAQKINVNWILSLLLVLSGVSLMIFSPIDSEERKLNRQEKKTFHRITMIMVISYAGIYMLLSHFGLKRYAVCIALGIILSASLQFPCLARRNKTFRKCQKHF